MKRTVSNSGGADRRSIIDGLGTLVRQGVRAARTRLGQLCLGLTALAGAGLIGSPALAVPAFAVQTGQPCQTCHVGGFGPQLTPFGRTFKLQGYTMRAVDNNLPFAAMAVASYLHTLKDQPAPPADGFDPNNNFALDQISLFFAGGLGSHLGAFVQATYDGVAKTFSWDNIDLRATTSRTIGGSNLLVGVSLNNSPTNQDAWNTLPAWGFPYTDSALAPSPSAAPLLAGALAQTSLGATAYAWLDSTYYVEVGAYGSPSAPTLQHLGSDPFDPGAIHGLAPYGRVAVQKDLFKGTAQAGLFALKADLYPGRDRTTGATDSYRDVGADASYQMTRENGDVVSLNARYVRENRALDASEALGLADNAKGVLNDARIDASYYWRNKYGLTAQLFQTSGTGDAVLYADNRTERPNSAGLNLQVDTTLFGDGSSPLGPRFNMRIGAQYSMYSKFDGARTNYDGAGAKASDNNTLRVFTWMAF